MSDVSAGPGPSAIERLAPFVVGRTDRALPMLIGVSLFVHATVFLPSLFHQSSENAPKQEIPVEIVQLPPKAAEAPKPPPPKPPSKPEAKKPDAKKPDAKKPVAQKQPQQPARAESKPAPKPETKSEPKPQPKPQLAQKPQAKPQVAAKPQPPSGAERMKQLLGPMPAIALPGATANGDDAVDYTQLVLSKVAKAKKQGRYSGIPGASAVAFKLGDAGELVDVHIVRPSGDPTLDEEAIAMIKRGAPYPPPPPGGRRDYAITLRFHAL